jgi:hypothetical protein
MVWKRFFMGRRKKASVPVGQITVKIADRTEVFELKRELLDSRTAAIDRISRLRELAARFVRAMRERAGAPGGDGMGALPFSPDLSPVRTASDSIDCWNLSAAGEGLRHCESLTRDHLAMISSGSESDSLVA